MRILAAQLNSIVGDLVGNTDRMIQAIQRGKNNQVDLVLFPELALSGYPPQDFLLLPHFMQSVQTQLERLIKTTLGIAVIVGLPRQNPNSTGKGLYNSAAIIENGKLIGFVDKFLLPTYDVFDERRYFEPGETISTWSFKGETIGITICEDLWQHSGQLNSSRYSRDPVLEFQAKKPTLMLNLSASPYSLSKFYNRLQVCAHAVRTLNCPLLLCNQVGGNDSLIFDGYSLFINPQGVMQCAKGFNEDDLWIDTTAPQQPPLHLERNVIQDLYQALVLGIRDYFKKLGFTKACLGLSGGVDSAVVACLAAEALGPQQVLALGMPSRYSAEESKRDARQLAQRLGLEYKEIPIETPFESYLTLLDSSFAQKTKDLTQENLQARIRGMLLMAFSNQSGYLVLNTGNKSELAMGYSTLYGDMCGALAVIGDVTKQQVYALAAWINRHEEIIPAYIIQRSPSAELRPHQKDSDSLPDYAILDQVLQAYIERHQSPEEIAVQFNYPLGFVQDLIKRIHQNEYKRRQAPPVLRVSEKAFSVGRHFPIVQRWV